MDKIQLSGPAETTGASGTLTLVSLAEVLAYLEVTSDAGAQDALIQTLIDSVCQHAFSLMGGRFLKRPATEFNYVFTPSGRGESVLLHQTPVGTISVCETGHFDSSGTWTAYETISDYYLDARAGALYRGNIWGSFGGWPTAKYSVRVSWPGGFTSVPADAKEAVCQWVGTKLQRLRRSRWDVTSLTSAAEAATYATELPQMAAEIFEKYKLAEATSSA